MLNTLTRRPLFAIPILVLTLVILAIAWVLISPLFISQRVDEAFPVSAPPSDAMGSAGAAGAAAPGAKPVPTVASAQPTSVAAAPTAMGGQPTVAPAAGGQPTPEVVPPSVAAADTAATSESAPLEQPTAIMTPEAMPTAAQSVDSSPVELWVGHFNRLDQVHGGSGTATIYRLPGGSHLLRLENFEVTNGPDLYVVLSGNAEPGSSAKLHDAYYVELSRLKGNVGNQNYEIPADVDLAQVKSVIIYCRAFTTLFSIATLAPAA